MKNNKVLYAIDLLLKEANLLRRYSGKPFLSKKDIIDAWYMIEDIYPKNVIEHAKRLKRRWRPDVGFSAVDRIINRHIVQKRTGIEIRSMQYTVPSKVKDFLYKIAYSMEKYDDLREQM